MIPIEAQKTRLLRGNQTINVKCKRLQLGSELPLTDGIRPCVLCPGRKFAYILFMP